MTAGTHLPPYRYPVRLPLFTVDKSTYPSPHYLLFTAISFQYTGPRSLEKDAGQSKSGLLMAGGFFFRSNEPFQAWLWEWNVVLGLLFHVCTTLKQPQMEIQTFFLQRIQTTDWATPK